MNCIKTKYMWVILINKMFNKKKLQELKKKQINLGKN